MVSKGARTLGAERGACTPPLPPTAGTALSDPFAHCPIHSLTVRSTRLLSDARDFVGPAQTHMLTMPALCWRLQIEHHLFPAVSFMHYPAISKVVKEECEKVRPFTP
eukprot:24553-Prorocentrum_minimum.AAC.1